MGYVPAVTDAAKFSATPRKVARSTSLRKRLFRLAENGAVDCTTSKEIHLLVFQRFSPNWILLFPFNRTFGAVRVGSTKSTRSWETWRERKRGLDT